MSKHTSGPWEVAKELTDDEMLIVQTVDDGDDGAHIAFVFGLNTQTDKTADARLVAAAPDLLSCCKELFDRMIVSECDHIHGEPDAEDPLGEINTAAMRRAWDLIQSIEGPAAEPQGRNESHET